MKTAIPDSLKQPRYLSATAAAYSPTRNWIQPIY